MISSRQNQFIKAIRKQRHSKGDEALLEGEHLVDEALALGLVPHWVLATPEYCDSAAGDRLRSAVDPAVFHQVSSDVLAAVADADSPQGVAASVTLPRRTISTVPSIRGGCYLYLDRLRDPGNLGAMARVAEAAGATALVFSSGCVHPNHPRALRASAGSLLRLPVAIDCSIWSLRERLADLDPRFYALDPQGDDLYEADLTGTAVFLLGSEGPGLGEEADQAADQHLSIPIAEPVDSLNVTVAAAIALFERRRRIRYPVR